MSTADPVADEARLELRRIADRWLTLPVGVAVSATGAVRSLAQSLADETSAASRNPPVPIPDLGPGVVIDQLTVTVYDASAAGLSDGLAERLASLRRALP
jgi:hypothetical protein